MRKKKISELILTLFICISVVFGIVAVSACASDDKYYTVVFDTDGGSAIQQQSVVEGGVAVKPAKDPTKEGYIFAGWFSDAEKTEEYIFSATVTENITIYAKWTENSTAYHSITFLKGNAAVQGDAPAMQSKTAGEKFTLPENTFTFLGYEFICWTDGERHYYVGDEYTMPAKDVTFTAVWQDENAPDVYRVIFNGGENATGSAPTFAEKHEGEKFTLPANTFEYAGHVFAGWYDGEHTYGEGAEYTMPAKDVTFTAHWVAEGETVYYTVTFDTLGGSKILAQYVESGKCAVEPETPVKSASRFDGWYEESAKTEFDFGTLITEDITLYAKWVSAPAIITIETNGANEILPDQELDIGSKIILPATLTKSGYTFTGWFTDEECTVAWNANNTVEGDMTLYAGWAVKSEPKNYAYNYSLITGLTDKNAIKQENFTGDNSFLKVKEGCLTYRHKDTDSSTSPNCIEVKNDGLQVTFEGTGTISITFASTGTSNVSGLQLLDADGNIIKAKNHSSLKVLSADDAQGNKAGTYTAAGTSGVTAEYEITVSGTYTIYCSYYYVKGTEVTSRGSRITAIVMQDNV